MEISHRSLRRVDVLGLSGRMQAPEAEQLQQRLNQLFAEGKVRLVLDLAGLTFMSSAGLRVLIEAQRRAQNARSGAVGHGEIRLAQVAPNIKEMLAVTGFTSFFPVYDALAEAVASF